MGLIARRLWFTPEGDGLKVFHGAVVTEGGGGSFDRGEVWNENMFVVGSITNVHDPKTGAFNAWDPFHDAKGKGFLGATAYDPGLRSHSPPLGLGYAVSSKYGAERILTQKVVVDDGSR